MINFSDSTPAAPNTRDQNIKWQQDVSGNVSGYITNVPTKQTLASASGVLTIDASTGNSFLVNLTENITSITISNATDGQEITILWVQDGTGLWTVTFPSDMAGATAPSTTALSVSCQQFTYDTTASKWYAIAAGKTGM